jgi:hypothetical protein
MKNLPDNIVAGFNIVFKFAALESDSVELKAISVAAINMCDEANSTQTTFASTLMCQSADNGNISMQVDTTTQKDEINVKFTSTLSTVEEVTTDKYFGISGMASTGTELNKITSELNNIQADSNCRVLVQAYCAIYLSAEAIVSGMGEVNKAINSFTEGDEVKMYKDNAGSLTGLHALPYFGVIALVFFTFFHWRGGVCCCCSGGSKCACLALLPFLLFWLVSFVIYLIILAVGFLVKTQQDNVNVDMLNGKPTMKEAIDHVQTKFPEFWKTVFEDLESSLATLFTAALFITIFNLLIFCYCSCELCCRPFKTEEDDKGGK